MDLKSRSPTLPMGPAVPVGAGSMNVGVPEAGHVEKLKFLREQAHLLLSLKEHLRVEVMHIKPVVKGIIASGFAIGLIELGGLNLDQAQKKGGMTMVAIAAVAKTMIEIKALRRDIQTNRTTKAIETVKLSKKEQEAIAQSDSFERKTALLFNPHLKKSALDILLEDSQFQLDTVFKLNEAKVQARRLRKSGEYRHGPFSYDELYVAASRMIERYMHTLEFLAEARGHTYTRHDEEQQLQLALMDPARPTLF